MRTRIAMVITLANAKSSALVLGLAVMDYYRGNDLNLMEHHGKW